MIENYDLIIGILKVLGVLSVVCVIAVIIYAFYEVRSKYKWYRKLEGGTWYQYRDEDSFFVDFWSQDNSLPFNIINVEQYPINITW